MANKILNAVINAVFPARCILCDEIISPDKYLCNGCHDKIEKPTDNRCIGCGLSKKQCECDRFVYHFDGVISPFYNQGGAKTALYNYKFLHSGRAAEYYAIQMAQTVLEYYSDIKFDFMTYVCSSNKNTEFDHCGMLATELSDRLNIELIDTLEPTDKIRGVQHRSSFEERFSNVRGAYRTTVSCKNRKILLVDDIKTSGATIDECARQLKFAGAEAIYCVTALIGSKQNEH